MSLQINIPATFTVTLEDGRSIILSEEDLFATWSFGHGNPVDFGQYMNFLKFLAELGRRGGV
ncbi:MAG TPA: hypothetical protein VKQ11_00690 [Candidatus Sulfotelmatobacter sp.]|nr:hypothetical protein [Candidatus Sulfotelmatobacter sp.]